MSQGFAYGSPPAKPGPTGPSGKAIASLILGVLSFCLAFVTGVPAVILGALALGDIGRSQGQLGGHVSAIIGIVTGGIGTCLTCFWLILVPAVVVQSGREAAQRAVMQANLRTAAEQVAAQSNLKRINSRAADWRGGLGALKRCLPTEASNRSPIKPATNC